MARLPDQIGKYDVVDRIGKGGMGLVYKAHHPTLDRFVILKKLNVSGDAVMRERFRREAEIMIDFRTDYVVDVYDHFRDGKSDYIALEYVDGDSLDDVLGRERYLPNDVTLLIARDCFRGLDYVHGKGVVHRDVKPGNVILGRDGSVKLLDFGIASRTESFEDDLTRDGMTLGTVAYIAPEQIEQSRTADIRADIYSAGAMLYEMATGRKAFSGGFTPENVNRIQKGRFRPPRRVNPHVSKFLSRLILRCMKRNPKRRYQSAGEIAVAIDRHLRRDDPVGIRARIGRIAGNDNGSAAETSPSRRLWPRLVLAAAAVVVLAAAAGYVTGYFQRFFLGETHALVQYQLRLRKGEAALGELPPGQPSVSLTLQRQTEAELASANPVLPLLHPVTSLETPDYIILRSRLLTLPAGRYRSTIQIGETYVRDELSVLPAWRSTDVQLISAQYDPAPLAALTLTVDIYDGLTGTAINNATVQSEIGGAWVDLFSATGNETETGVIGDDGGGEILVPVDDLAAALASLRGSPTGAMDEQSSGDSPEPGAVPEPSGVADAVGTRAPVGTSEPRPTFAPGETIRLRVSHAGYHTLTTELSPGRLARTARARLGMIPIDVTTEEN
jgi:eukaryotic-like serine/threonine-protein kinase